MSDTMTEMPPPSGVTRADMDEINRLYKAEFAERQAELGKIHLSFHESLDISERYKTRIAASAQTYREHLTAEQRAERVAEQARAMAALAAEREAQRRQREQGSPEQVQQALDAFTGHADPRVAKW